MSGAGIVATADRIPRLFAIVIAVLLAALTLGPACAAAECTIHGSIYDWSTFDTINNAIVDVYSMPDLDTPLNHYVARTGTYTFSLPAGSYTIIATAGTPGTSNEITVTEYVNISASDSGERIIDLILFPPGSLDDLSGFADGNVTPTQAPAGDPTLVPNPTDAPAAQGNWDLWLGVGAIGLAIAAIVVGLVLLRTLRPKKTEEKKPAEEARAQIVVKPPVPEPVEPGSRPEPAEQVNQPAPQTPVPQPSVQSLLLPEDCRQVLAIIEKNDGRITQLDLRKMLPYSEAKVSLIVSDLESRGLVKKIKKGRGNVLILNRPGERPPEN